MPAKGATTVGKLAKELGVDPLVILDACKRSGVTAWSEFTPIDDLEMDRLLAVLQRDRAAARGAARPAAAPDDPLVASRRESSWSSSRNVLVTVLGVLVAATVGIVGGRLVRGGGEEDPSSPTADEVAGNLPFGTCWEDRSGDREDEIAVASAAPVDCALPHDAEVFAVFPHPAAPGELYPGEGALTEYAASECAGRFTFFVGRVPEESSLDIVYVTPSVESWFLGIREISCSLLTRDGSELVGTAAGSAR